MSKSDVQICNRALQKVGAARITSLTQDTPNARACNVAYAQVRDAELRAHPWAFAIRRAQLASDATAPDWGKQNAFQLPTDFLALAPPYAEYNSNARDWKIEGQKIYTNDQAPLQIRYMAQVTDPNLMDALFIEALSTAIAVEICEEITQSNTKKDALKNDYDIAIKRARKANAFDNVSDNLPEDTFITCRY